MRLLWAMALVWALMFMAGVAMATILTYTVPRYGRREWIDPSQGPDSFMVDCSAGSTMVAVDSTVLYWQPISGGGYRRLRAHSVLGSEGLQDTFDVAAGNYYVIPMNSAGGTCVSNIAYVPPADVTGVPIGGTDPDGDRIERIRWFDVRGRLVSPIARGVYFWKAWYHSGRVATGDSVFVR